MVKIDDINKSIIKYLQDGRKSYKEIANELCVAENTVRARVNKMSDEDLLSITGLINPEKIPGQMIIIVGVKLSTMNGIKKGEEMSKLKGVVSVCAVTGRFDLILVVCLNESFGLAEFISQELDKIKDLQYSETFVVYKSYNIRIPYILD